MGSTWIQRKSLYDFIILHMSMQAHRPSGRCALIEKQVSL